MKASMAFHEVMISPDFADASRMKTMSLFVAPHATVLGGPGVWVDVVVVVGAVATVVVVVAA